MKHPLIILLISLPHLINSDCFKIVFVQNKQSCLYSLLKGSIHSGVLHHSCVNIILEDNGHRGFTNTIQSVQHF